MSSICYHLYMFDNDRMVPFCLHCGHEPKKQNKKVVACPECRKHQTVDINCGVECNNADCMVMFEAFDAEEVIELRSDSSEEEIERFVKDIPF